MLGGKINPSLRNLNYLNYLDLSWNDFEGIPIPSFVGSLKSLIHLDLSNAGFGGLIPHQLGNLSCIRYLNLEGSFYLKVEKLQWISALTSLQFLDMTEVDMSKAYDWVQVLNTLPSLVELRLSYCVLGNISPDLPIINFTSLSIFDISSNELFGLVPHWLFSLKNLHSLYLRGNLFEELFQLGPANMTNRLKILDLSSNRLNSTIPQWLGGLNRLEFLDLSLNIKLQGNIPASIGNLTSMVSLDLSDNQLDGEIPNSFGNLFRLRKLQLSSNKLSGPIPTVGKLSELQDFDVSRNQLCGCLPMDFGKLSKLRDFDVSDNQLNGSLPMDFGKLSNLQYFIASNNQLNGSLPESFGQLAKLQNLDISNNSLKGMVHEVHLANLSRLKVLIASGNSLNLETSPNWVPPFQLETLKLNSWHLGPKLPLWLRRQQHLSKLQISNAGISGTIPIWFCNISSQLETLDLSHNQFYGPFPCHVALPLSDIYISYNQFNGSLPLISSKELVAIDFSNNLFSGSVTQFFCDNSSFSGFYIFLGNNLLSGTIPNCWRKWEANLRILNLENNNLVEVIPSSMGNFSMIYWINMQNNSLSGELPLSLKNSTSLNFLDLSGNKFSGKIPEWIGTSLSSLLVLSLRSNNFEGYIPLQLCNLPRLQVLDLAHNNLSGTIPTCFYKSTAMGLQNDTYPFLYYGLADVHNLLVPEADVVTKGRKVGYTTLVEYVKSLDLSGNNLDGEIPAELTKLDLQTLNLSKNHLVGKIPSKIGNMRGLESLDLSQNQLSGEIPASMSNLSFLNYLNLSCNNLTGQIPTATQLQSFDESSFIGNNQLCGPPLQQNCSATDHPIPPGVEQGHEEDHLLSGSNLYMSLGLGFAFGFWAVLGSLLFNVPWRIAFCGNCTKNVWFRR
ncbi:hypothetical protein FNV43_RR24955 [Rhamnella rubrinervis]|uniref:Disease resistance R13L4/SHOC-2-like LRR domain-containing protein n=1 Tax=Rhamnella rubrinervis TaxID=2594499 RepID=A0A8K0DZ40_9ROSA|nr:hypothetical protein FNV43_RR24955 [Rhamnella rubrinervis]